MGFSIELVANVFEARFKFPEMRARPVNLSALGTTAEIFVVNFRQRLELIEDFSFADLEEQPVALQATPVWRDEISEIEPSNHLNDLLIGIVRSRAVAMAHDLVHKEAAIAREQSAVVSAARGEQ